ncbi:Protein CBG27877 [Caenorhabditis briggsae]|uniref:Protein CBG27877 n=1 Tax=Caenorhabditis briggsae TaxID=6238 RepID=B6IEH2_CAEBR|nr:Protein CBG27877 [Caenorhabditis briggsae]CAR98302.1 Protein CBG27877 [Caenorhabditis briggsae]
MNGTAGEEVSRGMKHKGMLRKGGVKIYCDWKLFGGYPFSSSDYFPLFSTCFFFH